MKLSLFTNNIEEYLQKDEIIDYENAEIVQLADSLWNNSNRDVEYVKKVYEFVRDCISHSADINEDLLTCSASEVLAARHGICFAKSHLLAALLRCKSIPVGFCYQKLILDDETAPILIYHGLNGVYIKEYKKWIRLDARGNKEGVNAQFSLENEQLAFPIRHEKGEEDGFIIYPNPDKKILEKFKKHKTRTQLWDDLPTELGYKHIQEKITLCGDNCIECPRYNAHSNEELRNVAELWHRVDWRDHIVSNEEIRCEGCSSHKTCTYHLVECTKEHNVEKCNQCAEFPCGKISSMLERSKAYQKRCKEVCSDAEYKMLSKAFFDKENNLKK